MKTIKTVLASFLSFSLLGATCMMTGSGGTTNSQLLGTWQEQPPGRGCATPPIRTMAFQANGTATFTNFYICSGSTAVNWSIDDANHLKVETNTAFGTLIYPLSISGNMLTLTEGGMSSVFTKQ